MEDLDTCRICSAPAEPEAPLFHPCKCSGTIRYIHQDCLTTWLAHSKKKTCDVCKYQYSFTKVYSDNMPNQIPLVLFLRKFVQKIFWGIVLGLRGILVATIWLAILPYVTIWTWRFYFVLGDNIAWWTYDKPRPYTAPVFYSYFTNLTYTEVPFSMDPNKTLAELMTNYPVWRAVWSDIFTGQIIAAVIVLFFLGVFLLREWIMQNARPGVFDEGLPQGVEVQDAAEVVAGPDPQQQNGGELVEMHEVLEEPGVTQLVQDEEYSEFADGSVPKSLSKRNIQDISDPVDEAGDYPPSRRRKECEESVTRMSTANGLDSSATGSNPSIHDEQSSLESEASESPSADYHFSGNRGPSLEGYRFTFTSESVGANNEVEALPIEPPQPLQMPTPLTFAALEAVSRSSKSHNSTDEDHYDSNKVLPPSRPTMPNMSLSAQNPKDDPREAETFSAPGPSSEKGQAQSHNSPGVSTYRAPEQLHDSSPTLFSDPGLNKDYFTRSSANEDSDGESEVSSAAATVLDMQSREEDFDEYFVDEGAGSDVEDAPEQAFHRGARVREDNEAEENPGILVLHEEEAQEVANDAEALNEDDVDGALEEAIGMRGPLIILFQNAALVIFVLDTTIGLTIWVPFTVGKTVALLVLDPPRMLEVVNLPIRLIRYATDPMVDFCIWFFMRSINPITEPLSSKHQFPSPWNMTQMIFNNTFVNKYIYDGGDSHPSMINRGFEHLLNSPTAFFLEPYFAALGMRVRIQANFMRESWIELANADQSVHRFFAIALGYAIAAFVVAIYLHILSVGSVQSAGRAIRNAIRQQLVVLKVVVFILIELVLFPVLCGIMLDLLTLELFADTTVATRIAYFRYAPSTSTFYHWMIGTMFMYQFAILLGNCRKVLRPGALWFIKDPQDQNFHPIRDILEKPTFNQLRKLVVSATMYSFVVMLGMGGLVFSLRLWGGLILPLRWKTREPLSKVPVDLVFMHIVVPYTIKYFRPRRYVAALARDYWRWVAKVLSLSSFLFGEMNESGSPPPNVRYMRVPAQNNISIPHEIDPAVPVNEQGEALDEAGRRLIALLDAEAVKARRDPKKDYTTVYLPSHFRMRICAFIALSWTAASVVMVSAFVMPTILGRTVFKLFYDREVHDGYSFVVGMYLLGGCFYAAHVLDRMDKRRQRVTEDGPRAEYAVYIFKRSMLWIGNFAWVAFWLAFVIPSLIGLVVECYINHPARLIFRPNQTLHIKVFDVWAAGLIYTKLALSTRRMRPETRMDTALKMMRENGWRRLDAVSITLDIIAPVGSGLAGMLLLPLSIVLIVQQVFPNKVPPNTLFLAVYPTIFVVALLSNSVSVFRRILKNWAQQIRDSEFLVEMRLRNLEPTEKNSADDEKTEIPEMRDETPAGPRADEPIEVEAV